MKTNISPDQIATYQEQGFLVIENFLDAAELAHWRAVTEEAVAQRLAASSPGLTNQTDPDAYYSRVFTQCVRLADTHAGMHEIMFDPQLGKIAATLAGVDGIRIWHDQALIKPPYGNPTGWHLDDPFWSFWSRDSISIWVALDDATLANGCMWYVPGSQKTATFERNGNIGKNIGDMFKAYPEWTTVDTIACPCPAGSAVFHNGMTGHGAGANMTRGTRRAMTCAYMPDGSTFNGQQNILPQEYFESLKIGDVLNNNQQNPLIWHKSMEQ